MAQTVKAIAVKGSSVPMVYEGGDFVPIVTVQLVFSHAGHLSNTQDGLADLSAKLLNEGTRKEGSVGFATKLDDHAIELHAGVGRETLTIELSALKSELPYGLEMLNALLQDPNYTPEALAQIKRQKIGWLQQKRADFDFVAATKLRELLFEGSALARPYHGTLESVDAITLEDIKQFISTHLGYNNLTAVVGGDITVADAEQIVKAIAKQLPKVKEEPLPTIGVSSKKLSVYTPEDTQQAYIYFASPFAYGYDQKDQYKAKIAEYLLGGAGFGSRLMEELRVKRGLTYGAYAHLIRSKSVSYLSGYLQTKIESQEEAKRLIEEIVEAFVTKGITQKELEDTKQFLLGSEPLRTETLSQRLHRAYNAYYYGRALDFDKAQLKKIEQVTLQEMNHFILSHPELANLSFSIVTTQDAIPKR